MLIHRTVTKVSIVLLDQIRDCVPLRDIFPDDTNTSFHTKASNKPCLLPPHSLLNANPHPHTFHPSIISLSTMSSPSNTKIQRQTQISRPNPVRKPIRSQHRCILIRNATQLQIRPSLLITPLQIEIRIGDTICHAHIPRR
jgi:hypothetical protein